MGDFLKCECPHCGQSIEYLSEGTGQTVPCPTCAKPIVLTPINPESEIGSIMIPPAPAPVQKQSKEQKPVRTNLSKLTEETIRARTKTGDTPLHRAAKTGRISEIPRHLLTTELFMARNNSFARETPLHLAARYGHFDKVPKEFLTKETLTVSTEYEKKESKTGPTPPRTETPLHYAVRYGHADQIPKEFLTPEFLSIEASGYRLTVLHQLAYAKQLDLVPEIYANSEMWNLKDSQGRTPREILEAEKQREVYIANVRAEPATEKQKEKLRWFGCTWDEGITKGQASDVLDECAKQFPEKNAEHYNRRATEEQLAKLREINASCDPDEPFYDFEEEGLLTYGRAKDVLQDWVWYQREKENEEMEKEIAYSNTETGKIDSEWEQINTYSDYTRDVTREEVAKAWMLAKSRATHGAILPKAHEVMAALEELHPNLLKPKRLGVLWHNYCLYCRGQIEIMIPPNAIGKPTQKDIIETTVQCPHCNRDTTVTGVNFFTYNCPNCSKAWSVPISQGGRSLRCRNCQKEFVASSPVRFTVKITNLSALPLNYQPPTDAQLRSIKESGFTLDPKVSMSANQLDSFLKLEGLPPQKKEVELFRRHGITFQAGDAFAAYGLGVLIGYFEEMTEPEDLKYVDISKACLAATSDPDYSKPMITRVTFVWPKRKLQEWYRKGAIS